MLRASGRSSRTFVEDCPRSSTGVRGSLAVCRLTLASLLALTALAVATAPALAAEPPETPISGEAKEITATTATLEGGVLNPKATGGVEGGEYRYLYNPSPEECNDDLVSEPSGIVTGLPKQPVPAVKLTGLEPNMTYSFCLEELKGEEFAIGPRVNFKTLPAPPEILTGTESASATGFSVFLFAAVNPNNEATKYAYEYATSEAAIGTAGATTVSGESPLVGFGEQGAALTVTGLTQDTTYFYRVVVANEQSEIEGKAVVGPVQSFLTLTPETPQTLPPSELSPTGTAATLNGVLNPKHAGEEGTYEFVYRQSATECERAEAPEKTIPSPAGASPASSPFPVSAPLTGLLPGKTYTYCLLAHTSQGEALGPPVTFVTPAVAPTIAEGSESFSDVGSTSATLHASISPGGAPTTYFFEYGTTMAYGFSTTPTPAGGGSVPVAVLAKIEGLQPETEYHFRAVAANAEGSTPGIDATFSTFPLAALGLPDKRGYELVSPLEEGDAAPLPGRPVRAAPDGSAVAYIGTAPPTGGNGEPSTAVSNRPTGTNVFVASRRSSGGWSATDIQPTGLTETRYQGFSDDLSIGILGSEKPVIAGAPIGNNLYARDPSGDYQLLATNAQYEGATPTSNHILVKNASGLYDSTAGQLEPINVLPTRGLAPNATFGSPPGGGHESEASLTGDLERVISEDGSRIFWTALNGGQPEALYVREDDTSPDAVTMQVDRAEPGCGPCESGGGLYWTASSDGSKVFFTDERELTSNSTATSEKPDLYEYQVNNEIGKPGTLTDLTPNTKEEPTNVVGVLGASTDGAYIYFAAAGGIANTGASHQECLPESNTKCNVFVVHEGEAPKLVAMVTEIDGVGNIPSAVVYGQGAGAFFGDWVRNVGFRSAHVTSDGRHLVFESFADLTATFHSGGGREIFAYDFGSGVVSCVSCNPTGAPTIHGGFGNHADAELPESINSTFVLRDVSADGDRVFFISNERLVSQSTNGEAPLPDFSGTRGITNVYEWEREGTDESCPVATPAHVSGGCIFLLSQGASSESSYFLDASESGDDVFFESRAQLVPEDHGETLEVYDARVGATQPSALPACTGAGCQGVPAAPPSFATPSSETAAGIGNFPSPIPLKKATKKRVRCAKGKKLSHNRCVRAGHKKKSKPKKSAKGSK
jgi:hypothetical protein